MVLLAHTCHGFWSSIRCWKSEKTSNPLNPYPGWWYTYPSENDGVRQLGIWFPTEWKNKCSKPPTSIKMDWWITPQFWGITAFQSNFHGTYLNMFDMLILRWNVERIKLTNYSTLDLYTMNRDIIRYNGFDLENNNAGLVNVLIEHHPNIGDIISNRYLKVMWTKSPKWNIYQTPVIFEQVRWCDNNIHGNFGAMRHSPVAHRYNQPNNGGPTS